jgi:hypothetical protein
MAGRARGQQNRCSGLLEPQESLGLAIPIVCHSAGRARFSSNAGWKEMGLDTASPGYWLPFLHGAFNCDLVVVCSQFIARKIWKD